MSCTSKAWIVGTERHLHHVEQTFCDLASLIRLARRLVSGHLDWRVVVGSADDEICPGHDAALIGPVMMRESAARGFDDANPFGWDLSWSRVNIR